MENQVEKYLRYVYELLSKGGFIEVTETDKR